ncbi:MAG: hypothetical protein AAGL24_25635 [Pseudomonadota bacterium]
MALTSEPVGAIEPAARRAVARSHPVGLSAWPSMAIRIVSFLVPMAFLAVVNLQPFVEAKWMFLDPLTAAELSGDCCHTYYGFVSTLGIMMWVTAAAVCLFAAFLFLMEGRARGLVGFALAAGVFTGWLALDDAFLVHEVVFPSIGIPQNAVLATYALLAMVYLACSWRIVLAHDYWLFLAGGSGLALSMAVDTLLHSLVPGIVMLEDSAKFFGIFCWMAFHVTTVARILVMDRSRAPEA